MKQGWDQAELRVWAAGGMQRETRAVRGQGKGQAVPLALSLQDCSPGREGDGREVPPGESWDGGWERLGAGCEELPPPVTSSDGVAGRRGLDRRRRTGRAVPGQAAAPALVQGDGSGLRAHLQWGALCHGGEGLLLALVGPWVCWLRARRVVHALTGSLSMPLTPDQMHIVHEKEQAPSRNASEDEIAVLAFMVEVGRCPRVGGAGS